MMNPEGLLLQLADSPDDQTFQKVFLMAASFIFAAYD
jgi:hypothetical protein